MNRGPKIRDQHYQSRENFLLDIQDLLNTEIPFNILAYVKQLHNI
jgi:hypothetical protein